MSQLFSNNAETTLAANITDVATAVTLTSGTGFQTPTGGDYELLTLTDGTLYEIVRMTARTGIDATVTRAQEGTVAQAWVAGTRVYAGVTAGTLLTLQTEPLKNTSDDLNGLGVGDTDITSGTSAVAIGHLAFTSANYAVAVGWDTEALEVYAVGVGPKNSVNQYGIAVGNFCWADDYSISIGTNILDSGTYSVTIGSFASTAFGIEGGVAIGSSADVAAGYGIALGATADVSAAATNGIAIGDTATVRPNTIQIGALPVVPRTIRSGADANAIWQSVGAQSVVTTAAKPLTTVATFTLTLPANTTFFLDEVGVIVTAANTVTVQPTVRFGITGTLDKYVAATLTTGLTAVGNRHRFTTLSSNDGAATLTAEITVAATATTLTGKFYWKGWAVSNV